MPLRRWAAVGGLVLLGPAFASSTAAGADGTGGVSADAARGGVADPAVAGGLAVGTPAPPRPVARIFSVAPRTLVEGRAPSIRLQIDRPGADRVQARVVVWNVRARRAAVQIDLGSVATGQRISVTWPRGTRLRAGRYVVRVHAKDGRGAQLARAAGATGKATLTVRRGVVRKKAKPAPVPTPPPPSPTAPVPGTGVFPVAGAYTIAGPDGQFGADRGTHRHEGVDLLAAAGTPVVAPVPGTVAFVDFQQGGAGYYVVLNADDGRSMFFAHCQEGSVTAVKDTRVAAGAPLCRVGSTGRSSGPHLHFEIWEGGWRDRGGTPIDPLPQLRGWER
jgi:hypothetical protein